MNTIRIVHGDITTFTGDVITNAAKPSLLGGGGVDGAIRGAAGPGLYDHCLDLPHVDLPFDDENSPIVRCPTGHVVPTPAYCLPCKWIFHTVGPVWPNVENAGVHDRMPEPGEQDAVKLLRSCYDKSGRLAHAMDLRSIAFPAISTGVYGCPMDVCAVVALGWARHVRRIGVPLDVTFYIFDAEHLPVWTEAADDIGLDLDP